MEVLRLTIIRYSFWCIFWKLRYIKYFKDILYKIFSIKEYILISKYFINSINTVPIGSLANLINIESSWKFVAKLKKEIIIVSDLQILFYNTCNILLDNFFYLALQPLFSYLQEIIFFSSFILFAYKVQHCLIESQNISCKNNQS